MSTVSASNMKAGVRIIECMDGDDPGSEGRLLHEVFKLMGVSSELVQAGSIKELIALVRESKYKYVHISTHGVVEENAFKGWWSSDGIGKKKAFASSKNAFNSKCLISTACMSGSEGFGKHVVGFLGAKYYIAPKGSPYWHNAALFSHIFYFKLFRTKGAVRKAFNSYAQSYKNPHEFKLFQQDTPS